MVGAEMGRPEKEVGRIRTEIELGAASSSRAADRADIQWNQFGYTDGVSGRTGSEHEVFYPWQSH